MSGKWGEGHYLADVEDLGSRRIVGFSMDDNMRAELVEHALTMSIDTRGGDVSGMIFHHDRGQYMSRDFRALCARHGVRQSVGRTGSCHDCEHNRWVIRLTSDPCYDWLQCLGVDLSASGGWRSMQTSTGRAGVTQ